jgi:hypothetical protein
MRVKTALFRIRTWFLENRLPMCAGVAAFLIRIPFSIRYDLHFQSDAAILYLMAKRILKGEVPLYFWNQEHYGSLIQLVTAGFLWIFGPSIITASLVTALQYALSVTVATWYVRKYMGTICAVAAGAAMVIGVPFMHHYTSMPSDSAYTFSILAAIILVVWGVQAYGQNTSAIKAALFALVIGLFWYLNKQVVIALGSIGLGYLLTANGRKFLMSLVNRRVLMFATVAFLVGYSPELIYKVTRKSRPSGTMELFGLATPSQLWQNAFWVGRGLPAYFDGDPLARTPEGVHYLQRNENLESLPRSLFDWVGVFSAVTVLCGMVCYGVRAWRAQNHPELVLAIYPLVNFVLVAVASVSHASYYSARRYIFSASVFFFMWWGICLVRFWKNAKWRPLAWLLGSALALSLIHQFEMLRLPDELTDYRAVAAELDKRGIHYGISWFSFSHVLTALTNEKTVFATVDYGGYSVYQEAVSKAKEIGLVYPSASGAVPNRIAIAGHSFLLKGSPSTHGELSLAVYQRSS